MNEKPPPIIIHVTNPAAFSGQGSIIVLELADESAAKRVAEKIAYETGRAVTVRDAGFWFNFRSDIRRLAPAGEGPLFDHALDFIADPSLMKAAPNLVAPALAYATYALIRRRTPDDDRLSAMERSLNAAQRQRFTDALFGQLERLTAFDGRKPPDKFLDEGKGEKLADGRILYLNVMGRVGPGCFEMWTDQELAGAYMVKAAWSPIRDGRCG